MLDPILRFELWRASRRRRQFVLRWVYASWLILQMLIYYSTYLNQFYGTWFTPPNTNAASVVAGEFLISLITQQLVLAVLVTPIFVVGTITDEKAARTLPYLFMSPLTIGEIVVGKIVAGLTQAVYLLSTAFPLCASLIMFAGVDLPTFLVLTLVTIIPIFALSAFSVLISVWAKQTRDAILLVYLLLLMLWVIGLVYEPILKLLPTSLSRFLSDTLQYFDLRSVLSNLPMSAGWGTFLQRCSAAMLAWGTLGLLLTLLACLLLRPIYNWQLEQGSSRPASQLGSLVGSRPPVSDAAIVWKEAHVEGIAPTRAIKRLPRSLCLAVFAALGLVSSWLIVQSASDVDFSLGIMHTLAFFLFTFLVGIRTSGTISLEREQQTWEPLLLTPLATSEIVYGKYYGVLKAVGPYFLTYALTLLPAVLNAGEWALLVYAFALLHIVLFTLFMGAIGIWYSVKSTSSRAALFNTILVGYFGTTLIYLFTLPLLSCFSCWLFFIVNAVFSILGPAGSLGLSANAYISLVLTVGVLGLSDMMLLVATRWFLQRSIRLIARRETSRYEQMDDYTEAPAQA
jgi:ABC-type transport system involved in multi-copper enzyme maturation permease subunit